jgi:hypothetical protein
MTDDRPTDPTRPEAKFSVWVASLTFSIDPNDLDAVRRAYDRLAGMNETNRTQSRLRPDSDAGGGE